MYWPNINCIFYDKQTGKCKNENTPKKLFVGRVCKPSHENYLTSDSCDLAIKYPTPSPPKSI